MISRSDVLHVAALARLDLAEAEVEGMVRDLGSILDHVKALSEVDTSEVPPTAHVAVPAAPLREDILRPGLERGTGLAEAPRTVAGGFAVPAFVDEG